MHSLRKSSSCISWLLKRHFKTCLTSNTPEAVNNEPPSEQDTIVVQRVGRVTMIGINRPERKNSLDCATAQRLSEALDAFEKDESSVSGVLHGVGYNFCAGYDLKELADNDGESKDSVPHFGPLSNRTGLSSKPLVAALNGSVFGVGFELALMCDLRVIEEQAILGFLNRRFGIPILGGGTVRLPAMIGYSRAMDLILTGRQITADEACRWGLSNQVVGYGSSLGRALSLANSLVKFSQRTLLADRASAHFATFSAKNMEEALQFEKDSASHLVLEEGVRGAKKFAHEGIGRHGKFHNITPKDTTIRELDQSLL